MTPFVCVPVRMGLKLAFLALLLSIQLETCKSQCNETVKEISENGTVFQSAHFGREYGRKANCTWRTKKSRDHVTVLRVIKLKLLDLRAADNASCKNSNKLRIRGERVPNRLFIEDESNATCYAIPDRNSDKCGTLRHFGVCELLSQSHGVNVRYISTGCKKSSTDGLGKDFVWGFQIKYETFPCEKINQEGMGLITQNMSWSQQTPNNVTTAASAGLVAGVIVAILVVMVAAGGGIFYFKRKQAVKEKQNSTQQPQESTLAARMPRNDIEGEYATIGAHVDDAYDVIDRTAIRNREELQAMNMTSHTVDQSHNDIPGTSSEPSTSFAAYAQINRQTKKPRTDARASNRHDEGAYSAVVRGGRSCP